MQNITLHKILTLSCFLLRFLAVSEASAEKFEHVHELIFDEISALKRKIWIDVSSELRSLSSKINLLATNRSSCDCTEQLVLNKLGNDEHVLKVEFLKLLKGFSKEKIKSREKEQQLNSALLKISEHGNELSDIKSLMKRTSSVLGEIISLMGKISPEISEIKSLMERTSPELSEINSLMERTRSELNKQTDNLVRTMNDVNKVKKSYDELKNSTEELKINLSKIKSTGCDLDKNDSNRLYGPSFISDWFLMRAQDPHYVQRFVKHGLGVLPYKVEVQIRPTTGPNSGWTFHGDPAFQSDDDNGEIYGGIVYIYNESHVILVAPLQSNNKNAGVIINTGNASSRRIGNNHQTSKEAFVRVKVWAPFDFPEPDFKSDWLPLDITNSSLSYYEIEHGVAGYPGFINVQIRCNSSSHNLVSEGLGATMMHRLFSNAGGVVYAFNDKYLRLWTGYLNSTSDNGHYRLLGHDDGWGLHPLKGVNIEKGEFRLLSWASDRFAQNEEGAKREKNTEFPEWSAYKYISMDMDLLSFYIEASDGPNKGYRFRGYGNSQTIDPPFGGVVYSFSPKGEIRTWRPSPSSDGYLIHVHFPYGNGRNVQASSNAEYVAVLVRATVYHAL